MDSPVLLFQTPNPAGACESCINQSLGRALNSTMTRQEEWKARDHKTVCGLSHFISSQGQGEKMFGSWETDSFEEDGYAGGGLHMRCSEAGRLRGAGPTLGHWMSHPSPLVPTHPTI